MFRRVVRLVERRPRNVRLSPADVRFVLSAGRGVIDLVPTLTPGVYRLTPRGVVGFLDGPDSRFAVRPKFAWPELSLLLELPAGETPTADSADAGAELLGVLAGGLADRLREVTRVGLVGGYHEADTTSAFLRGRLRPADQMRDAVSRAFPDRFHVTEDVFDLDAPWHRIPRAAAALLLASPDLPAVASDALSAAVRPLDGVPVTAVTDADFDAAFREPRAAHYADLLAACRLVLDGCRPADMGGQPEAAFLLDLGRAFETRLTRALAGELARRPGWAVEPHRRYVLAAGVELVPDIAVSRRGTVRAVVDAKWKRPGPDPADLHQILAYAAVSGATRAVLAYPGRRFGFRELATAGDVRVALARVAMVGSADDLTRSVLQLAGKVCRA